MRTDAGGRRKRWAASDEDDGGGGEGTRKRNEEEGRKGDGGGGRGGGRDRDRASGVEQRPARRGHSEVVRKIAESVASHFGRLTDDWELGP